MEDNDGIQHAMQQGNNSKMHLLELNDKCLLDIFEYLNFADLAAIGLTCTRAKYIVGMIAIHKYRRFDYVQILHPLNYLNGKHISFSDVFRCIGEYIETVYFNGERLLKLLDSENAIGKMNKTFTYRISDFENILTFLPLIPEYCTNLYHIHIDFMDTIDVPEISPDIKSFYIYGFFIDDIYLLRIFNFFKFEELSILLPDMFGTNTSRIMGGFNGKSLAQLKGIKWISMENCQSVKVKYFHEFCEMNGSTLTNLRIAYCRLINESDFAVQTIANHLKNVEYLDMRYTDYSPNLSCLTEMKALKHLHLQMATNVISLFIKMAEADQLDSLYLIDCLIKFKKIKSFERKFFTHLNYINLRGNSITNDILKHLANNQLSSFLMNYYRKLDQGIVDLVLYSRQLTMLDIYCTEWIEQSTIQKICNILMEENEPNNRRPKLIFKIEYESIDNNECKLKQLVKDIYKIGTEHCELIEIIQNTPILE